MENQTQADLEYRKQIEAITAAFTKGDIQAANGFLAKGMKQEYVEMFVEGNFEKREDKLIKQLELVGEGIENLKELITQYGNTNKIAAYATAMSDGERMLDWLEETQKINAQQKDRIAVQRARHQVETLARDNRMKHVRFHEMLSKSDYFLDQFEHNQDVMIQLNPIRAWATLHTTELLEKDEFPPQDVLIYAKGADTHTANFEEPGKEFIEILADLGSCTFEELKYHMLDIDAEDLADFCRDLVDMGLIALG